MTKPTLDAFVQAAREAGESTANGVDGIMHLGKVAFGATRAKLVDEKSVKDLYVAYLEGANTSKFGSRVNIGNDKALKFGVSKLRVFVKFAALPGKADDNWNLVRRAVGVINKGDGEGKKIGSRYEQVVRVLRVANTSKSAKMTDQAIVDALAPKEREGDAILRELAALAAKAKKFAESDALDATQSTFFAAIREVADQQVQNYKAFYGLDQEPEADEDEAEDFDMSPDDIAEMAEAA